MPIYEYQCTSCNHHFDTIQKINDAPLTSCPECSKPDLLRLISAAGFQLKGSGWYVTDFKNSNSQKPAKAKESESNAETTKGSDSSESSSPKVTTKESN